MSTHLIDANVLIDVIDSSQPDHAASARLVAELIDDGVAAVNQIIYAEVLAGLDSEAEFAVVFDEDELQRLDLPWKAAWPAGQAHARYRTLKGSKRSPMPDFYIGAHAEVQGLTIVTRDATRYRTYFPAVEVVTP
ncbi:MAG: type II toxin-antitoxin system VapC family toxin [Planctomycetota bacterium]